MLEEFLENTSDLFAEDYLIQKIDTDGMENDRPLPIDLAKAAKVAYRGW